MDAAARNPVRKTEASGKRNARGGQGEDYSRQPDGDDRSRLTRLIFFNGYPPARRNKCPDEGMFLGNADPDLCPIQNKKSC
jgi:hypothetical protein